MKKEQFPINTSGGMQSCSFNKRQAKIADTRVRKKHIVLEGEIPSALNLPTGCPFHTRCHRKIGRICETEAPPLREFASGHRILCHLPPEELLAMEPVIAMGEAPRQAAAE